ncbi:regulator of microtubule dynamics protein 3-like isoform X2 [Heterodontus francisci]|uniref:regulator of microtubule dynamics protein 3-like isoform X2 n=1 Tax=Heterodontus francisci TaxID=7792 RepID=UPI00355B492A
MSGDFSGCGSRMNLGLGLGVAAGLGLMYLIHSKGWGKRPYRITHEALTSNAVKPRQPCVQSQTAPKEGKTQVSEDCANFAELKKQQLEIWEQLDVILQCVRELKGEVVELRECLNGMTDQIVGDVRTSLERCQKTSKKKKLGIQRERSNSAESNSIYFTANTGTKSSAETESEGGYTTANAESDNDREEVAADQNKPDIKCQSSESLDEFSQLLCTADKLHDGTDEDKAKGFKLLLDNKPKYHSKPDFCWRLARAYCDVLEISKDEMEKKALLDKGKEAAETGLQQDNSSAECHKWYAVLCGRQADNETIQNRIKAGYTFKEHIEKAIELKQNDASLYYLLGRWCYEVAQLGWIERKAASTFYGTPPSSTVDEALKNFLREFIIKLKKCWTSFFPRGSSRGH